MKKIISVCLMCLILPCVFLFTGCNKEVGNVSLRVTNGEEVFFTNNITTKAESVYKLLVELDEKYDEFYFEGYESQYGFYITSICGIEERKIDGGLQFWAFYVDGEYASVGISSQKLYSGIEIEFRYETFEF